MLQLTQQLLHLSVTGTVWSGTTPRNWFSVGATVGSRRTKCCFGPTHTRPNIALEHSLKYRQLHCQSVRFHCRYALYTIYCEHVGKWGQVVIREEFGYSSIIYPDPYDLVQISIRKEPRGKHNIGKHSIISNIINHLTVDWLKQVSMLASADSHICRICRKLSPECDRRTLRENWL